MSGVSTEREMPRWKCHKEVHALKIKNIRFTADGSAIITPVEKGYVKL